MMSYLGKVGGEQLPVPGQPAAPPLYQVVQQHLPQGRTAGSVSLGFTKNFLIHFLVKYKSLHSLRSIKILVSKVKVFHNQVHTGRDPQRKPHSVIPPLYLYGSGSLHKQAKKT